MRRFILVLVFLCGAIASASAQEIRGSGSTFSYPAIVKFAEAYEKASGARIVYQPIGSAGGLTEIRHKIVDFAVSEAPLGSEQLLRDGLRQFPLLIGAIVPIVNLDGVAPGQLRFTGPLLAAIYLGKVTKWNDPAIAALNPGLKLPDLAILVVHRSDGSGTTFNWANYLSKASPDWKVKVGANVSIAWPVGAGGKGNGGVADKVARVRGAIGYIDFTYAMREKLTYGLVQNHAGNFVTPDISSFQAATANVNWTKEPDFYVLLTDSPEENAYPIMAASFAMLRRYPERADHARDTLAFFRWVLESTGEQAISLGYLALPPILVQQIESSWTVERN